MWKCKSNCTCRTILPNQFSSVVLLLSCINVHNWPTVNGHLRFCFVFNNSPVKFCTFCTLPMFFVSDSFQCDAWKTNFLNHVLVVKTVYFLLSSPIGAPEVTAKYQTLLVYPVFLSQKIGKGLFNSLRCPCFSMTKCCQNLWERKMEGFVKYCQVIGKPPK